MRLPWRSWDDRRPVPPPPRVGTADARRDGCCFSAEAPGILRMGAPPIDIRTLRPLFVTGPSVVRLIIVRQGGRLEGVCPQG